MGISGLSTPQAQLEYYSLIRNILWRYKLDEAEEAVISRISALLEEMRQEISGRILQYQPEQYTHQQLEELLQEISVYSEAVKAAVTKVIAEESGAVLAASLEEHSDILSVGGRSAFVSRLNAGTADFGALFATAQLGGRALLDWVETAFGEGQKRIFGAIRTGMFQGEGYQKIVRRVLVEATDMTRHETITLTRTYIQTANVTAQEAVFQRNSDVLGWLEWRSVMEPSYKQTGRGTCLICASLDGTRYRLNAPKPPMPRHFRCRCMWVPITDWERLGIPALLIEEATRPFTIRENRNVDAGGRRKILDVGMHTGDWASWASGRGTTFKMNALGSQRYALWQDSGLSFEAFTKELVNRKTGDLYTVKDLAKKLGAAL